MTTNELITTGLTHLWQVTLLIVIVAALVRVLARDRPHLAMALWLLVLIKCVTPPVVFAPFGVFCRTATDDGHVAAVPGPVGLFASRPNVDGPPDPEPHWEPSMVGTAAVEAPPWTVRDYCLFVWPAGVSLVAILSLLRVVLCLRQLNRSRIDAPSALLGTFDSLSRELGIGRRIRVVVTTSGVGPAVLGLFRPTIVVPQAIAHDPESVLRPILAHEMIHVRRGDLWISLLGLLTRSLWWFHPLVWWVGRQISRDIERACDEEVLAALDCQPGHYARSLLRVLERKNSLRAVPAFPGVRPVEITSQRMERIMSLRHGRRGRSNWRCRLLVVLGAALTLPGAVSSQEKPAETKPTKEPAIRIKATLVTAPAATIDKLFPKTAARTSLTAELMFGFGLPLGERSEQARSVKAGQTTEQARIRLLPAKQGARLLADLRSAKEADILFAPELTCRSGSTATCTTNIAT